MIRYTCKNCGRGTGGWICSNCIKKAKEEKIDRKKKKIG